MAMLISLLLLLGIVLSVISAIGIHRLKDPYSRLHATSTVGTLGLIGVITASLFFFSDTGIATGVKQILTVVFLFITVPAGTHILSRAALGRGIPVWKQTGQMTPVERHIAAEVKKSSEK